MQTIIRPCPAVPEPLCFNISRLSSRLQSCNQPQQQSWLSGLALVCVVTFLHSKRCWNPSSSYVFCVLSREKCRYLFFFKCKSFLYSSPFQTVHLLLFHCPIFFISTTSADELKAYSKCLWARTLSHSTKFIMGMNWRLYYRKSSELQSSSISSHLVWWFCRWNQFDELTSHSACSCIQKQPRLLGDWIYALASIRLLDNRCIKNVANHNVEVELRQDSINSLFTSVLYPKCYT